jgi:hypothetical protein
VPIFENGWVEFDFVARDGVDEGHDYLEESVDEERDVDDESEAKTFGVVRLEDIEHLMCGAEGGVLAAVAKVDEEVERSATDVSECSLSAACWEDRK